MKKLNISIFFLFLFSSFTNAQFVAAESNMTGKPAPAFTLQDLDGNKVRLSDYKGKLVILNFWATWCPPCIKEIPDFIMLYDKYKDKGFVMLGISLDQRGINVVKAFKKKFKVNYPILMADSKISFAYGNISSIPTTFVIDAQGIIKRAYLGYRNKNVFEKDIKDLLPNNNLDTTENKKPETTTRKYVDELNKIGINSRPQIDNAAPYYLKAIELYAQGPEGLNDKIKRWPEEITKKEKELLKKWVEGNEKALDQLKLGNKKSYCWFTQPGPTIESNPLLKDIRELFLVLQARINLQAEKGNISSVINDIVSLYKFGIHISNGPKPLDEKMVGVAIKGISIRSAFNVLNQKLIDEKSLKILEDRLKSMITNYDEPFDIRGEKLLTQEKVETDPANSFYMTYLQSTLEYLDHVATMTPWKLKNDKSIPAPQTNPWIETLAPVMARIVEIEHRSRVDIKGLITTLSILRYKVDKDRYPSSLSELISDDYLEKLPIDPFSNKPLVYKQIQEDFTLYSFGADLDDDGGQHSNWGYDEKGGDQVFWPLEN